MDDMTFELTDPDAPDYEFTTDWFTRHKKLWDSLIEQVKPRKILEIGSFEGRTTSYMIEKCGQWHPTEIFCVDAWEDNLKDSDKQQSPMCEVKRRFDKNVKLAQKTTACDVTVYPFVADSVLGLSQIASQNIRDFDLIYVDGSHIASTVLFDAAMAFQLCRVGGAIVFDDFQEDKFLPYLFPKLAIKSWFKVLENKVKEVEFFNDGERIPTDMLYQRYYWKLQP